MRSTLYDIMRFTSQRV